ncbi:MAG: hypothetical protein U0441_13490 [Polyangiaceae bacterium]
MDALLWVDGLYAELCSSFSGSLKEEARRLPFTLGLAREPETPWSHVFAQEITLAAPALVAEAMPEVPASVVQKALFAHALAVIDAMGRDRIEDNQVAATPALRRVLDGIRARRDHLLMRVADGRGAPLDASSADRELTLAAQLERDLLLGRRRVDFAIYEAVSRRKQWAGLLASSALAAYAAWTPSRTAALRRVLLSAAMGLQIFDDVIDWEEDAATGRAWAVALARGALRQASWSEGAPAKTTRGSDVHGASVLPRMLDRARFHFHVAGRIGGVLGAARLARWAHERSASVRDLAERERRSAGYVSRAHKLAPWAHAVLAPRP